MCSCVHVFMCSCVCNPNQRRSGHTPNPGTHDLRHVGSRAPTDDGHGTRSTWDIVAWDSSAGRDVVMCSCVHVFICLPPPQPMTLGSHTQPKNPRRRRVGSCAPSDDGRVTQSKRVTVTWGRSPARDVFVCSCVHVFMCLQPQPTTLGSHTQPRNP